MRERLDPVGMKHLGHEIAAEEAPRGAIESRVDVVLITVDDGGGGEGLGAARENGAVLNKSLVGERRISYEYRRL